MNGQISCEGPMGKTSLFDMEGLTAVDPASMFRKDDMSPKVRTSFATRSCLVCGCFVNCYLFASLACPIPSNNSSIQLLFVVLHAGEPGRCEEADELLNSTGKKRTAYSAALLCSM
jgi:hypothetical protein